VSLASAAVLAGVVAGSMPGVAETASKGIAVDDACTIVSRRDLEKAFGVPATGGTPSAQRLSCQFGVGVGGTRGESPDGVITASHLFPNFYQRSATARAAVEDRHAIDALSGHQLDDVFRVGRSAYLDKTTGDLVVLATRRFAFVLRWEPAQPGSRNSSRDTRALKQLARAAVARAPR
jgi:hypothetical protein